MEFANGDKQTELTEAGTVGRNNTGTSVKFWPNEKYFDSSKVSVTRLKQVLRAKAVLCPGLKITLKVEQPEEEIVWCYQNGLQEYLLDRVGDIEFYPQQPFMGNMAASHEAVEWGVVWAIENPGEMLAESYVNLVPTAQGGTHVNGLRAGLTEAMREFCDIQKHPAARRQGGARGCLGKLPFRAFGQAGRPAVFRPDQGTAQLPRMRGFRIGRGQRQL